MEEAVRKTKTEPVETAVLSKGLHVCADVLAQNPDSDLAKELREKLGALLRSRASSIEQETFMGGWGINEQSVERMDKLIALSEQKFGELGDALSKKMDQRGDISQKLLLPFDCVRENKNFSFKNNIATRLRSVREGSSASIVMRRGNFMYDLHPGLLRGEQPNDVGGFFSQERQFQLSFDYDPNRLFDLFTKYHEIWHVLQDDWLRQSASPKFYERCCTEHVVVIDFEFEAYAYMLEAIDCYLDGEPHVRCQTLPTAEDATWFHAALGIPDKYKNAASLFLTMGHGLWGSAERFTGENYPKEFEDYLMQHHRNKNLWKHDKAAKKIIKLQ
ncbi:hypothetical protein A3D88_03860 [Candidatus Peribacteria bacterium RIFCSPHIGHO2_02_FULL_52_16]|nr:MAG: hypothetical protein A2706_04675 [Candidatus Peribacteria bacterium RIFCSPHIGHO2_01_FULL_51_35]OGJ61816.1 MAG: hypothetical protein A3D88_03860 [Candidatus Peribacteria bacterium RIFCSPHIGHO2_02_FULL_52_16]